MSQTTSSKITETARYLTFRLGDELFAINVFKAREVLDVTRITRVPTAPSYMRGVVNVRGNAIPVVDLRRKFGLPEAPDTRNTRIIVMEILIDGETTVIGGLADSVHEVLELEPNEIESPPAIGMRWRTDLILGMGRREGQFLIILDIDKVFSSEDLSLVPDENSTASATSE
ncbi:MAG: chemotaxis protein CheW [Chthoniobacterales bacterium]|nr:chemotaxis protein CheW [Chthoniobacterales bacterium]MCX7712380.1 chemotaxis protein CheW [Chthoniobacterales bacterium]